MGKHPYITMLDKRGSTGYFGIQKGYIANSPCMDSMRSVDKKGRCEPLEG